MKLPKPQKSEFMYAMAMFLETMPFKYNLIPLEVWQQLDKDEHRSILAYVILNY